MKVFFVLVLNILYVTAVGIAVANGFGVSELTPAPQVAAASVTVVRESSPVPQEVQPLLDAVNTYRAQHGVDPVAYDADLDSLATARSSDMVKNQYYAHISPVTGTDFSALFDTVPYKSCENLFLGIGKSPSGTASAWFNSTSGHKECMLNPAMTRIGLNTQLFDEIDADQGKQKAYVTTAIFSSN